MVRQSEVLWKLQLFSQLLEIGDWTTLPRERGNVVIQSNLLGVSFTSLAGQIPDTTQFKVIPISSLRGRTVSDGDNL